MNLKTYWDVVSSRNFWKYMATQTLFWIMIAGIVTFSAGMILWRPLAVLGLAVMVGVHGVDIFYKGPYTFVCQVEVSDGVWEVLYVETFRFKYQAVRFHKEAEAIINQAQAEQDVWGNTPWTSA